MPGDPGQAETIDTIALIAVVASLSFVIGMGAIGSLDTAAPPLLDATVTGTDGTVTVAHAGGDGLEVAALAVIVRGPDNETRFPMSAATLSGDGDGRFESGESLTHDHGLDARWFRVLVVHEPTHAVIAEEEVEVAPPSAAGPGANAAPTAGFTYSPSPPAVDQELTFDASQSSDGDGMVTGYEWDWDDDGTYEATGQVANHTFETAGDHDVTLRVTDDNGATDTATVTLSPASLPPTALFTYWPPTPGTGQEITFDASTSTDLGGSIVTYEWDWTSDGTYEDTGETATHTYGGGGEEDGGGGTDTVTLRVTDDDGLTDTATAVVTVDSNKAPSPSFTYSPTTPITDQVINFDASGSSDQDGSIASYEWDWDEDGTYEGSGETTSHAYGSAGTYNVTLKVTDTDGGYNTSTQLVTVEADDNDPPTAAFSATTVDWYSTTWDYRKPVEIDHGRVPGEVSDFPVLVEVTDADLADHAQGDADDVVFTAGDGTTKLDHEVAAYDSVSGHLVAWVSVPTVNAAPPNTTVYLYYGAAGVTDQGNPTEVWDADYAMVQHLDETSGSALDSTTNDNDGVVDGANQGQTGKVGTAYTFNDNKNDGVEVADDDTLDLTDEVTISAWIRPKTIDDWNRIVAKSHDANHWPYTHYGLLFDDADHLRLELADCATEDSWCQEDESGATTVNTGEWTYATVSYDGSDLRVYHDGALDASRSESFSIVANDVPLTIGKSGFDDDYFDGRIDEVRVSSTARSADWIATEYNNTEDPSSFYTVGPEEMPYPVDVNASASADIDGSIASYEWDWHDDGVFDATGATAGHTYTGAATYTIRLRVTDNDEAADETISSVTVAAGNADPTPRFSVDPTAAVAEEVVSVDATASTDPDGSVTGYEWDWTADGTYDDTGVTATHEYETAGTHTIRLRATDDGGATATTTRSVEVTASSFVEATATANLGASPGGGAVVFADLDEDGLLDVFMNDDAYDSDDVRLRENDGDLTFTAHDANVTVSGGRGAGTGDVDNDGDRDLIVGFGQRLNENTGDFGFSGSTVGGSDNNNEEALMFVDVDADGDLDVWSPGEDYLWHENTDGGWTSHATLPGDGADRTANGEGATAADVDADGDIDLIWAQTESDVDVFVNQGDGTYVQEWDADGTFGLPEDVGDHENMEWAWGDYDTDGDLDVYISGSDNEGLYRNDGTGSFTEVTSSADISESDPDGAAWGDFDNDGHLDLVLADADGNADLYENDADGTFTEVDASANLDGTGDVGATVGWFDADNDGDLDLLTNDPVRLWNNTRDDAEYLRVMVRGNGSAGGSPLTPIGAQVDVYESDTGTLVGHRELIASQNQLQPPLRQHFGVDPTARYDVRVRFPSGAVVWDNDTVPTDEGVLVGDRRLRNTIRIREPNGWTMFMGGAANTGTFEASGPTNGLIEWWSTTDAGSFGEFNRDGATVVNETVYVGNKNNRVYALDASDGSVRWEVNTGGEVLSTPAVRDDTVYVGTKAGELLALDASTGDEDWNVSTVGEIRQSSPAVADDTVYVGTKSGQVHAVWSNGTERWSSKLPSGEVLSSPAVGNGSVYVGDTAGDLYAFDASTGGHEWTFSEGSEITYASPTVVDGTVYVGDRGTKTFYAIDAGTGAKHWEFAPGEKFTATSAVAEDTVYVGTTAGTLYALDAASGSTAWSFAAPGEIHASAVVVDGTVYVGDKAGDVYAVDGASGAELASFSTGAEIHAPPVVRDDAVYVGTKNGRFYALIDSVLFADDFDRADSNDLGGDWTETEDGADDARIADDRLDFEPDNLAERPSVEAAFPEQSTGTIELSFTLNFERTGSESWYAASVQLGDGDSMVDPQTDHDQGVAANLKWGGNDDDGVSAMSAEEGFGYTVDGADTQVGVVSGADGFNIGGDATVTVTVDLDANTYDVSVTGPGLVSGSGTATDVPFEEDVDVDTLRIFLDEVEPSNFGDLEVDDVEVEQVG